jgi:hypothetical protein
MRLSESSVSFDDTRIQSSLGENLSLQRFVIKAKFRVSIFSDSLDLNMVTSKNQNSVSDSSTVFYPSANIFIIKYGNELVVFTN